VGFRQAVYNRRPKAEMQKEPTDLRKHSRQTRRRLILGGLGLIFVVGLALIALTYGTPAAACGFSFFLIALLPVGLILLIMAILQWLADRVGKDE
jgi:hypothetical protein